MPFMLATLLYLSSSAAMAGDDTQKQQYNIPAQPLADALRTFSDKSGLQLLYDANLAAGKRSAALRGAYPPQEALGRLLAQSGLEYRIKGSNMATLVKPNATDNHLIPVADTPEPQSDGNDIGEGQVMPKVTVEADADNPYDDPTWQTDPYNRDYVLPKATAGTKTNTPIMETPLNVQSVTKQVLKDQQVTRLNQALKNVSGVTAGSKSGANNNNNITLRGFRSDTYFRNGFRLQQGSASREVANVEAIEVLKGPAAVLYGLVEPGGMVNVVTKQPLKTSYYALNQQFGSYDFYRTTADLGGPLSKDDSLLYRLNVSYENSGSFREFVSNDNVFLAPVVKWNISPKTQVTLEMEYQHLDQVNDDGFVPVRNLQPYVPISTNYSEPLPRTQDTYYMGLNWSHQFNDDWSLKHQFSVNKVEFYAPQSVFPYAVVGNEVRRWHSFNNRNDTDTYSTNLDLTGHFDAFGLKNTMLLGGDFYRTDIMSPLGSGDSFFTDPETGEIISPGYSSINLFHPVHPGRNFPPPINPVSLLSSSANTTDQYGLYLQDQIELPYKVHVTGGFRYQYIHNRSASTGQFPSNNSYTQDAVTPRVGLLWQPQDWLSIYGNYAESFGANSGRLWPTRNSVPPTSAEQYEIGFKTEFFGGRLRATAAYYDLTKTDVVTGDPDPEHNCGQGPGDCSLVIGAIRSHGPEIDIQGEILPGWNMIATYAYTDTRVTKTNQNDDPIDGLKAGDRMWGVPHNTASFWTTYQAQEGLLKGFQIGGGVNLQDSQTLFSQIDRKLQLAGFATVDLMAGYSFEVGKTKVNAQFNISNLLDKQYFTGAYVQDPPTSAGFSIGTPRTFMGSINVEY